MKQSKEIIDVFKRVKKATPIDKVKTREYLKTREALSQKDGGIVNPYDSGEILSNTVVPQVIGAITNLKESDLLETLVMLICITSHRYREFNESAQEVVQLLEKILITPSDEHRSHGPIIENMTYTAELLSMTQSNDVTRVPILRVFIINKLVRESFSKNKDNLVDAAGYLLTLYALVRAGMESGIERAAVVESMEKESTVEYKAFDLTSPPKRATAGSAGFDIYVPTSFKPSDLESSSDLMESMYYGYGGQYSIKLPPNHPLTIPSYVSLHSPDGKSFLLRPRSSWAQRGLAVLADVIDSDFTGEFKISVINLSRSTMYIPLGSRVIQAIPIDTDQSELTESVDPFQHTARGSGGFGSTGEW